MAVDLDLLNANSITNINTNFTRVQTAFQDALSRSGNLPNHMNADLDMNSNDILNIATLQVDDITIGGTDMTGVLEAAEAAVVEAQAAADEAEGFASDASASAGAAAASAAEALVQADRAEDEADRAAGYIPAINPGDAFKALRVNVGETGGEWAFLTTASLVPFSINFLSDVDTVTVTPVSGDGLVWNGSNFVPGPAGGGMFKGNLGTTGNRAGDIFRVNSQALTVNTTIAATENASATGPLTVNSGITLTVASGGTLTIL